MLCFGMDRPLPYHLLPCPALRPAAPGRYYSARARLLPREHGLIAIGVTMRDGTEQSLVVHVMARHRHAREISGRGDEQCVLQADRDRRANLVVTLFDH